MIVSHKHKFIFLKTMKTAGTSIELFLSSYCGPDDIIAPLSPKDEFIRRSMGLYPQNHLNPKYRIPDERTATVTSPQDIKAFRLEHRVHNRDRRFLAKRILVRNHMPWKPVQALLGPEIWNSYHKFCFERAPWDRALSLFYFVLNNRSIDYATDQQVYDFLAEKFKCNSRIYCGPRGRLMVDEVLDFDDLRGGIAQVSDRFGFDIEKFDALPKLKSARRIDRRRPEEFLSQRTIDRISEICKPAIEIMGYQAPKSRV